MARMVYLEVAHLEHLHYLGVLTFIGGCALAINFIFKLHFSRWWKIFIRTDLVVVTLYLIWDIWATQNHSWSFDSNQTLGITFFNGLPIEEVLFFIIVPLITILCYQALLKLTHWQSEGSKSHDLL